MKKIAQNGSNWLHFSETNHACSENTEIHSENEGNNGVEPVSGPNNAITDGGVAPPPLLLTIVMMSSNLKSIRISRNFKD